MSRFARGGIRVAGQSAEGLGPEDWRLASEMLRPRRHPLFGAWIVLLCALMIGLPIYIVAYAITTATGTISLGPVWAPLLAALALDRLYRLFWR